MENQTKVIAERLKMARHNAELTVVDMAEAAGVSASEYERLETGEYDFSFTFLFKCASKLGMDISELVSGSDPKLSFYNITRAGEGMPIRRRAGFNYRHLAPLLKNRMAEPFVVTAKYDPQLEKLPVALSTHKGQEFDFIISGEMKVQLEDHTEILHPCDSVFYDSGHRHGMIAVGGNDCVFLAVVFKGEAEIAEEPVMLPQTAEKAAIDRHRYDDCIYHRFMNEELYPDGRLKGVSFNVPENFNFGYDVVDELAKKCPDKRAMLWLSKDKEEIDFTFGDISRLTNKAANFLMSLGVKRGDRIMLVLRRSWHFWIAINALHKLGAVAVPATSLLVKHDYEYRFDSGCINGIITTETDGCAEQVELALDGRTTPFLKILAGSKRDGWHSFDDGMNAASEHLERVETSKDDPCIMFFTSGTTGYPKIAMHTAEYPLGHIVTAAWWHNVDPEGLHFTIADTGWGKALWGKLYGAWLCEAAVFVYDFTKFHAEDLLPMFAKYNITTFCAPPTMYRFFIKEELEKYDLSSLQYITTAGEALNPEVFNKFYEYTGLKIMEGFGQTETTLTVCNLFGSNCKVGSMGLPNPQYDVRIVDVDCNETKPGEVGEIVINTEKGTPVGLFGGYYRGEAQTEACWHDGFYHTGDTAWRDEDGYFWFVGRVDDVIKSSGYRIGPFEIESVIMELPYVLECAVTGVPDDVRGQVVKATIVTTKGTVPSEELKKEIQTYVKSHTAPYKYPRVIEFVESLPKTISGKIKRNEIRNK